MKRNFSVAIAMVVGVGFSAVAFQLLHDATEAEAIAWSLLLYAVMIAGVFANHLYGIASERHAAGQSISEIGKIFSTIPKTPRLWMALAVSPFLYHAVHDLTGAVPRGGTALFFAFQNGFFWQAVFAGFQQRF
jgi:hypothetical protein